MTYQEKFDEMIVSYLNGNISWVKSKLKKMSKAVRTSLYEYAVENYSLKDDKFFFKLIYN